MMKKNMMKKIQRKSNKQKKKNPHACDACLNNNFFQLVNKIHESSFIWKLREGKRRAVKKEKLPRNIQNILYLCIVCRLKQNLLIYFFLFSSLFAIILAFNQAF